MLKRIKGHADVISIDDYKGKFGLTHMYWPNLSKRLITINVEKIIICFVGSFFKWAKILTSYLIVCSEKDIP